MKQYSVDQINLLTELAEARRGQQMALLAQTIAIAGGAAMSGETKGLDKWVQTLVGKSSSVSPGSQPELTAFIRQLEAAGKVKIRDGTNRR